MNHTVSFPGLGLEFEINRVAFSIGSIDIYWYAIIIATGFCLALWFVFKNVKKFGIDGDRAIDVIFFAMIFGIVGARLYFVAFQWENYAGNLAEIFNIRGGGLGFYGGVIGGIIGIWLGCKIRKLPFWPFMDIAAAAVLIGQGVGRWGNFVNGECFGCNTTLPWGMTGDNIVGYILTHSSEEMGFAMDPLVPVHPTFFYESLWCAIGFAAYLLLMKKRRFDGEMTLFYIGWNGFGRMLIEGLRTDSLMLGSFRVSQLLGGLMAAGALILWLVIRSKIKRTNDPSYMMLWRDTETGKLQAEGKWDYKKNVPKEEPEAKSEKDESGAPEEETKEESGAEENSEE